MRTNTIAQGTQLSALHAWEVASVVCDPMDYSLADSSIHEILQARILERVVMPSFGGTSPPKDETHISYVSCIDRKILYH